MKTNYWDTFQESSYYHVYNRGNNSSDIFFNVDNYHFFLKKFAEYISPFFDVFAFTLLPNHFHFILKAKVVDDIFIQNITLQKTQKTIKYMNDEIDYNEVLVDQFKRMFSSYTLAVNKQQNRTGSLFQRKFKRVLIKSDLDILKKITYVHHNPIHHGYCNDYSGWEFSSFNSSFFHNEIFNKSDVMLLYDAILEIENAFISYHKDFAINFQANQ